MDYKGLRALLVVHGFITMAAGIVLTVAPGLIPSVVGIRLDPSAHVVAYLLAGVPTSKNDPTVVTFATWKKIDKVIET